MSDLTLDAARNGVSRIVGRCHVGESNREMVTYLRSRFTAKGWRNHARMLMRAAILEHRANLAEYVWVMGGHR